LTYAPGWCPRCRTIVHVEDLDTPAQIDERLSEFELGTSEVRDSSELLFRRAWMLARRSPARCLRCFEPGAVAFPHGRRVPHPDGGAAWVTSTMVGFVDPMYGGEWLLTPEGLPVESR
jgi:hypothetical protein